MSCSIQAVEQGTNLQLYQVFFPRASTNKWNFQQPNIVAGQRKKEHQYMFEKGLIGSNAIQ